MQRVTHLNHSDVQSSTEHSRHPPTQLDLALVVDEDVGTLEAKEGERNISTDTSRETSEDTNTLHDLLGDL